MARESVRLVDKVGRFHLIQEVVTARGTRYKTTQEEGRSPQ